MSTQTSTADIHAYPTLLVLSAVVAFIAIHLFMLLDSRLENDMLLESDMLHNTGFPHNFPYFNNCLKTKTSLILQCINVFSVPSKYFAMFCYLT